MQARRPARLVVSIVTFPLRLLARLLLAVMLGFGSGFGGLGGRPRKVKPARKANAIAMVEKER